MPTSRFDPTVTALSVDLLTEIPELSERLVERIRAEIPLYQEATLVGVEQLAASCRLNLRYILSTLVAAPLPAMGSPYETGVERAASGVPYAAVLQAFRIGGRFVWELLVERAAPEVRDRLLLAAAEVWSVTDDLSAQVTEGYREAFTQVALRDDLRRAALLGSLLDDNPIPGSAALAESARMLGLDPSAGFVVVVVRGGEGEEAPLPGAQEWLRRRQVTSAWRLEGSVQEGLVELRAGFGAAQVHEALERAGGGRSGVSEVFAGLDRAQLGLQQARLACAAATPGSTEVVSFDGGAPAILLAARPQSAAEYASTVLAPVFAMPMSERAALVETIRTWLAHAGSTSAAAEALFLHRNTVRYRLRRLEELTGLELGRPIDAARLHWALEAARITGLA
ncbi:MAG: helix-turn-helix domain-containing protein [Phycicoccus sp.]|nr:helix-turn-helix domain-containing protein [Phycicoccus sp.]